VVDHEPSRRLRRQRLDQGAETGQQQDRVPAGGQVDVVVLVDDLDRLLTAYGTWLARHIDATGTAAHQPWTELVNQPGTSGWST
jgi:hypothetical protein